MKTRSTLPLMVLILMIWLNQEGKADEVKKKKELEKSPKSLFLIKKIKISPDVGGPQFDPAEAQLRTVINDAALHNLKKFE